MSISGLELLARIGIERVLNSIPQGVLIAAFAWLLLRVFGIRDSATRFVVWFFALFAIAAAPFLPHLTEGRLTHAFSHQLALPDSLAIAVFAAWIVLASVVTSRFVIGFWKLRKLRGECIPVSDSARFRDLQEVVARFTGTRNISLCTSKELRVPTAVGFFRPLIILPEWSLQELTAAELKVILLHEFAHLRRWDDWTNLAQQLVRTIFFFHPAVIWIERRLALEREMACDDVVLAETRNPHAYAECLVKLAEKTLVGRALAVAQAAISHARQTCLRLTRILDADRATSISTGKAAVGISGFLVALCLIAILQMPKVVVVENTAPSPVLSASTDIAPRAIAIPAIMRSVNNSKLLSVASGTRVAAVDRPHRFDQIASKQKHIHRGQSLLTRAALRQRTRPAEVLVLTRMTEFDGRGSAIVNISFWYITFVAPPPGTPEVVTKSI